MKKVNVEAHREGWMGLEKRIGASLKRAAQQERPGVYSGNR